MSRKRITRREFLKAAAVAPAAAALGCSAGTAAAVSAPRAAGGGSATVQSVSQASRVVLVRDAKAVVELRKFDGAVVQKMLDDAVTTLFGVKDPASAWKRIVGPGDTVGIKTNVWNSLPTGKEVEETIRKRVLEAGVPADKLAIDDRGVLQNTIFQNATVLINARPARVHYWSGMGSCIKNYITFVPRPAAYHDDACADLATIWSLPHVKGRTKLNVLVMLTPQYHNIGPRGFNEKYLWTYGGLIVGQDVVAVDATGYRIIQAKRREAFGEDLALETSAHHIELADTRHKLGRSDPKDIELIKLGWTEGALV
jgi:citrate lyase gamma subunit